jgi:molybdate transport repressor ModE-like protein
MNTRFLATLCAVADAGSLAAAARQLNLANASVSEHIAALEKSLGATLVTRRGRHAVLTEAGQAILGTARSVLAQIEDMRHLAQPGDLSGHLRVGAISTALISVMPPALRRMAERHPRIEVKVLPGTSTQLYRMLERGELDCALTAQPHFTLPKSLAWHRLREEPLVLIAPESLPGGSIGALLQAAPFIRMDRESWTGRLVDSFLKEQGLPVRELFELDAQEAIVILVAQGLGVSLLPDWGIEPPAGRKLRKLPVCDSRHARVLGLITAGGARGRLSATFADALQAGLGDGPQDHGAGA